MKSEILITLIIFSITIILIFYMPIIKSILNKLRLSRLSVDDLLEQLSDNSVDIENKSDIVVDLINKGYIQIHTLYNSTSNYNDKKQSQCFCSSMNNSDIVKALKKLG